MKLIKRLHKKAQSKIVMVVLDGLGGLPAPFGSETALETAITPNLNDWAARGICGLHEPIGPGITPGSGPGHLALFGYDPLAYPVGRGVLATLGIDFDLHPCDVAARGNFCLLDGGGRIKDRRAGRMDTGTTGRLCGMLQEIRLPGAELFVEPVKDYRFALVLRGTGLCADVTDTDPQSTGTPPLAAEAGSPEAVKTAGLVNTFVSEAARMLENQVAADAVLLRGFSQKTPIPCFSESFGLRSAAIAAYPMYRGISRLVGMAVLETQDSIEDEFSVLEKNWHAFDFFFLHFKDIDSAGEDGDFDRKVSLIEEVDGYLPQLLELEPDVIIVTGDHSSPAALGAHSWHPVPVLLYARTCRPDAVSRFGETDCICGGLGPRFPATALMPLAMGHAGRLKKFGA